MADTPETVTPSPPGLSDTQLLTRLVELAEIDHNYRWAKRESREAFRKQQQLAVRMTEDFLTAVAAAGATGLVATITEALEKYKAGSF